MFTLAHLSDWHLAGTPQWSELASKRGLGLLNWHRHRKHVHRPEVLDATIHEVRTAGADHIAVTGDLVNFSLTNEYRRARALLETLASPSDVTVVPGNHDIYVPGAQSSPAEFWNDYMRGDDGVVRFPFLRRRGAVALIALSTALPTAPFLATGHLGDRQLAELAELLDQQRQAFRIILIHHPPIMPASRYLRRLTDAAALLRVLAARGAELLLHGHDHCRSVIWLDGPDRKIPAVGVPAASAAARHGDENAAGCNIFQIDGKPGAWRCEMVARERDAGGVMREIECCKLA